MADEKKSVEQAAGAIHDALEKRLLGQPEGAMAKVVVMAAAVASGSPWFLAAEPVLQRLLEIINNKAGKDAVAEIAGEVNAEEGFRKIALEVHQYVMPTIIDLFAQQHARGAIGLGQVVELTQSSIEDGIARVGIMLRRMEDRQASSTGLSDPHKPLRATVVLTGPTVAMHAVGREDQRDFAVVRAVTPKAGPRLMLELTNMSRLDVRPKALHVDVIECLDVDIVDLWYFYGLMRPIRKYGVQVEPRVGRYVCAPLEKDDDNYLVLSSGELDVFSVTVTVPPAEALYRVRTSVECSSAGETFVQDFDRVVQFGVYDPDRRVPVRDARRMSGPPPDDGGDTCIRDGMAAAMAIRSAAAKSGVKAATQT